MEFKEMNLFRVNRNRGPRGGITLQIGGRSGVFTYSKNPGISCPDILRFLPGINSLQDLRDSIFEIVSAKSLYGVKCNLVLHPDSYRLLLIDRPNVLSSELVQAAKWQVKDIIDYPLEESVVDVFSPAAKLENLKNKVYVVVAKRQMLKDYLQVLQACELKVEAIDIHEMAIRNILHFVSRGGDETLAFLQIFPGHSLLLVCQDCEINFVRRIDVGLDPSKGGEYLAEEIEKSFSYYTSEFGGIAPHKLFLSPASKLDAKTLQELERAVDLKANYLDLNALFSLKPTLSDSESEEALGALGEMLRDKEYGEK